MEAEKELLYSYPFHLIQNRKTVNYIFNLTLVYLGKTHELKWQPLSTHLPKKEQGKLCRVQETHANKQI